MTLAPQRRRDSRDLREEFAALALAGPATALIVVFLLAPLVCIALLSLTDYQLGAQTLRFCTPEEMHALPFCEADVPLLELLIEPGFVTR